MSRRQSSAQKLLFVVVSLFWFSQYVYVPYQTPYLIAAGETPAMAGLVIGAYGLSQLLLRLPAGLLADRRGRHKPFILLGVLAAGAASLCRVFQPDGAGFLIANLLSGLGSAMWISFMVLYFSYFAADELQKATGMILAANNLGVLGGFVAGAALYGRFGMTTLCLLSVGGALPALLLALRIKEAPPPSGERPSLGSLARVYADRRLLVFSLFALLQQGVLMSTTMSFTNQAAKMQGATAAEIGLCSIVYIVSAVGSAYWAASDGAAQRGARFWIPLVFFGLAVQCLLIPLAPSIYWFYPAQILSGLSSGILFSYCTSEAMRDIPPAKKSTAMGFHQAIYAVGMTAMPILTGRLAGAFGTPSAFYWLGASALLGCAGALYFYNAAQKKKPAPTPS